MGLSGASLRIWLGEAERQLRDQGVDYIVDDSLFGWVGDSVGPKIHGFRAEFMGSGAEQSADVHDEILGLMYNTRAVCYRATFSELAEGTINE